MGWKSRLDISRDEAIAAIRAANEPLEKLSNSELEELISNLNVDDDPHKPYCGYNVTVND